MDEPSNTTSAFAPRWKKTPYVWGDGHPTLNRNTYNRVYKSLYLLGWWPSLIMTQNSDCQHPLRCESPLGFVMTQWPPVQPSPYYIRKSWEFRPYHHISRHQTVSKQPEVNHQISKPLSRTSCGSTRPRSDITEERVILGWHEMGRNFATEWGVMVHH